jgi:phage-related protein
MKKQLGFINIFILIIILVLLALYFGKNPVEIWEKIKPIFTYLFQLFIKVVDFLIKLIIQIWNIVIGYLKHK